MKEGLKELDESIFRIRVALKYQKTFQLLELYDRKFDKEGEGDKGKGVCH